MNDTVAALLQVGGNISDLMFSLNRLREEITSTQRPSTIFRPAIGIDGDQWCALYGPNIQEGIAGFGDTPELAMHDFDNQFRTAKLPGIAPCKAREAAGRADAVNSRLYHAVNLMMAVLCSDGEIQNRTKETDEVMAALAEIDGGVYRHAAVNQQMTTHGEDLLESTIYRIRDMLKGDDGQALKEAEKFIERYDRLTGSQS